MLVSPGALREAPGGTAAIPRGGNLYRVCKLLDLVNLFRWGGICILASSLPAVSRRARVASHRNTGTNINEIYSFEWYKIHCIGSTKKKQVIVEVTNKRGSGHLACDLPQLRKEAQILTNSSQPTKIARDHRTKVWHENSSYTRKRTGRFVWKFCYCRNRSMNIAE